MKQTLVLLCFLFINKQVAAQSMEDSSTQPFSKLFQQYDTCFQSMIVYSLEGSMLIRQGLHFRVVGENEGKCCVIDHYLRSEGQDSVVSKRILSCRSVFTYLKKNHSFLKSETEIDTPCVQHKKRALSNGSVVEVTSLHAISDVASTIVEYKMNGRKFRVQQLDPRIAQTICPQSFPRKIFLNLVERILEL